MMDAVVRYIKVAGGPAGKEGLLVGLKHGAVMKIYMDNAFPIPLIKHTCSIRCAGLLWHDFDTATVLLCSGGISVLRITGCTSEEDAGAPKHGCMCFTTRGAAHALLYCFSRFVMCKVVSPLDTAHSADTGVWTSAAAGASLHWWTRPVHWWCTTCTPR
eukprot:GHRQ01036009.1.p2 GENE.GHRQ01036009.1~~GHRQ01036009.1.p2  ORF type:complete len:159 (+),score=28.38 GHRQ01036009.1:254-730(+)